MLFEKTIDSEVKFHGRVFDCVVKDIELPDGSKGKREVVMHHGGACILPIDDDLNCYMVKQFRSPFERIVFEAPAGKVEPGEDPAECARREIVEETGYEAGELIPVGHMLATPGYCSEIIYLFLGKSLKYVGGNPDESEYLENLKFPLKDLLNMADNGEIEDAKTMCLIYKAARRLL